VPFTEGKSLSRSIFGIGDIGEFHFGYVQFEVLTQIFKYRYLIDTFFLLCINLKITLHIPTWLLMAFNSCKDLERIDLL
jgi:hypothetical protein